MSFTGTPVVVRLETPTDAAAIRQVHELAFGQSTEADLVDRLRDSGADYFSLVAEADGIVVAHILFTPARIAGGARDLTGMALAPMAVHPTFQRNGIGSLLVRRALQYLHERRCPFVVVVGHPEYYPRFGFERASLHGVACHWDGVPDDAFMIRILAPTAMTGVSGVAVFRREFDAAV